VFVWVMAAVLCLHAPADAAEIRSTIQAPSTEKQDSPYKKKIPGSTNRIAGSRPRTYLKPKKQTYQEHMESLKTHRFKNESESFGHNKHTVSTLTPSGSAGGRVITSSRPPSSRVQVQQRIGKPSAGMSRNQPFSQSDYLFMGKLSDTIRAHDPSVSSRLDSIMAGQKEGRTLTKDEYDYLQAMSAKVADGPAAYRLRTIAEKRRETQR